MMRKQSVFSLMLIGLTAALYVVLTFVSPMSYGALQFRISESLNFLIIIDKRFAWGIILGVFISNIFSSFFLDIIFGTLHTAVSIICCLLLIKIFKKKLLQYLTIIFVFSSLMFIIYFNIVLSSGTMTTLPFLPTYATLFASEAVVLLLSGICLYPFEKQLKKLIKK